MRYFTDRVVQNPGRVKMTPVSGQANTYDMERAEGNVTTEGTPFNATTFNGIVNAAHGYATCTTGASTAAKVAACDGFVLYTGACVSVRFTYANTSTSATLNVNGTGANPIRALMADTAAPTNIWQAGEVVTFVYGGTNWLVVNGGKGTKTAWGKARELITDTERSNLQTTLGLSDGDLATILNKLAENGTKTTVGRARELITTAEQNTLQTNTEASNNQLATILTAIANKQRRQWITPNISTSVGTLTSSGANQVGKVVMLSISVNNSSSVAAGSNIYEGTLNTTGIRPYTNATGASYVGQRAIGAQVTSSGSIIVRNSSTTALSLTNAVAVSFTYVIE